VAAVAFVTWRLLGARRRERAEGPVPAVIERMRSELQRVDAQIALLRSVRSWYLWPLSAAGVLWTATLVAAAPAPPALRWGLVGAAVVVGAVVFLLVGWVVEGLNRRAADSLAPYRAELAELVADLERD